MNFSNIAAQQREKEQKAHRSILAKGFIGSVALHIVVLLLCSLGVRKPEIAAEPEQMPVMMIDKPSLQGAKPKGNTQGKIVGIGKPGGGSGIHSVGKIAASQSRMDSQAGGTSVITKKPSQPTETATTDKPEPVAQPVAKKPPQPVETPKKVATLPSVPKKRLKPMPRHEPVPMPKPVALKPPQLAPTPMPQHVEEPSPAFTPSPIPTATPEPRSAFRPPQPALASPPLENTENGAPQSDTLRGLRARSNTTNSGNRQSSGSTRGFGLGKTLGNGAGNTTAVATGSGNTSRGKSPGEGNGSGSTSGSGSGGLECRSCPAPAYPPGSENLEGRAVVLIDVDSDGNVKNVKITKSTGDDTLDQTVKETVKEWKFVSSENGERVRAAVDFAQQGSDFYHQALDREHRSHEREQARKRERQTRKLEQF
jgi:TonB family protein